MRADCSRISVTGSPRATPEPALPDQDAGHAVDRGRSALLTISRPTLSMSKHTVERQGDIAAIEGTRVTIDATANDHD